MMDRPLAPEELRQRILAELRDDGRASYSRIAAELGVHRHQVTHLVQQAIELGELRITASISPDLLGLERFAYLQLSIDGPITPIRNALVSLPETTFVADISGPYAIDAEVRVGADPHLGATIDHIRSLPGVAQVRTHPYESIEVNLFSPLRTGTTGFVVDDADRRLIQLLQENGRATFRELGAAADLSASGARLRLDRLMRHNAVKVVGIPVRGSRSEFPSLGIGVRAAGTRDAALAHVRALSPEFLALTVGEFDLIATLSSDSADELLGTVDTLRSHPEIAAITTWANLRIVKEQYGEGDRLSASPRTPQAAGR